jgi:hypothetical protein
MGRMRSSNWEDARNFHFLMIVQMIAVPPTQAATTMSTVSVVRVILAADETGAAEADAEADVCVVIVTFALDGVTVTGVGMTPIVGVEVTANDGLADDADNNTDEVLEVVGMELDLVSGPVKDEMTLLRPDGPLAEGD